MRTKLIAISTFIFLALGTTPALAQQTEEEIVNSFLKTVIKKQSKKLGWLSLNVGLNRINRNNDYNRFVGYENSRFTGASWEWLNTAPDIGLDLGLFLGDKLALTVGGEYWPKFGQKMSGTFTYNASGTPVSVTDPSSELTVWAVSAGVQYYLTNPPSTTEKINQLGLRVGTTVGWYSVSWDLWPEYQNLNLATSATAGVNTTYKGNAPGFSLNLGADYPLGFLDMAISGDIDFLYLNFSNVAWYNLQKEEVVATWNGTADSRVDLALSGVRGKIQIKRFIAW